MPGPVNTPAIARKKALAVANQVSAGTAIALTSADCLDVSSVSYQPNSITATDPRYTGTIHRRGPVVLGATYDVSFEWPIHGHGSGTVPAADAFIIGRILKAWGFTEQRFTTAIAAEAYSAPSATAVTLGATAVGTAQLYKGLALNLANLGVAPNGFAMIADYTAAKVARLARNRTLSAGNYSIPLQLAYTLSSVEPAAGMSITVWEDGHRLNFVDMRPTAATITLNTASRDQGDAIGTISGTFSGTLLSETNEACPAVAATIAIPPFRNGQQDVADVQIGGSSVTIDLGIRSAFLPNPNQTDGSDPGVLVEAQRTVTYNLNKVSRTVIDWNALANAQTTAPSQFLYGLGTGNYVGVMIDANRFDFVTTQEGGDFITTTGTAYIDNVDKAISLTFPIY